MSKPATSHRLRIDCCRCWMIGLILSRSLFSSVDASENYYFSSFPARNPHLSWLQSTKSNSLTAFTSRQTLTHLTRRSCPSRINSRRLVVLYEKCLNSKVPSTTPPQNCRIPIIFENDDLLAIVKPPHIPHHDDPSSNELGIMSILRKQQESKSFSYPHRLYGIHRLDRVTSGILLLAKSPSVANSMIEKFRKKEVIKYYIAISGRKAKKKKQGWVKGMMTMGRRGSFKLVNESDNGKGSRDSLPENDVYVEDGDEDLDEATTQGGIENKQIENNIKKKKGGYAVTRFFTAGLGNLALSARLISTIQDHEITSKLALVPKTAILFLPHTGKTHQLRVAAKSVGLPILGDMRYSGGKVTMSSKENYQGENHDLDVAYDRTYLHASAIHFNLNEHDDVTIWSPPPFGHLFEDPVAFNSEDVESSELNEVFVVMMEKYCDCPQILEAIRKSNQK
mmetsp:Transcript_1949/g.4055  ORF Transcript_1949/g.4055 Transcript_1949/m.4055 type:complete len:451 (-) Transcript_1949:55-1407(-)